jgi:hypothetical protein
MSIDMNIASGSLGEEVVRLQERVRCAEAWIQRTEEASHNSKAKAKDVWDVVQILSGLLTPLVLAVAGFYINSALQRPQLELSNAKEIQTLLAKLGDPNVTKTDAEASAVTLAAFGSYSIGPLLSVLQNGGDIRIPAAEKGLRIIGITNSEPVCEALVRVLRNRTQLFNWLTHKSAIRLLGDLDCRSAIPDMQQYGTLVDQASKPDGLLTYQKVVQVEASAPLDVEALRRELQAALGKLQLSGS